MTALKRSYSRLMYIFVFLLWIALPSSSLALKDYSKEEAEKVLRLIDQIHREQAENDTGWTGKVVVTESELNSYIAYRIEEERSEIMKELRLKIHKKNRIEGKIYVDLRDRNVPKILQPEMNFYFDGTVEVKDNLMRLNLNSLYLENQKISSEMLNMVIYVGSKIQNTEPFRLNDWFELPYGIKNIESDRGRVIFYY